METKFQRIFFLLYWIFTVNGAPPSETSKEESCVLSLTIPKDSIKSNCNMNEQVLRKMHSMDVQFNHFRAQVGSLEIRFPEIMLNVNRYNDKVEQLELLIAKESTFYKHMEGRITALEDAADTSKNTESKHITEPDTLLDPLRPYVMAELQQMKEDLRKEILNEIAKEKEEQTTKETLLSTIKSLILAEMQYVKQEILKSLKDTMTIRILDQNEEIGSSDEIENHVVEDVTPEPKNEHINMVADQAVQKEGTALHALHDMARILQSIDQNNMSVISTKTENENIKNITKEMENEITNKDKFFENSQILKENLQKTIDILQIIAKGHAARELDERIDKMGSDINLKVDSIGNKLDEQNSIVENLTGKFEESSADILRNFSLCNDKLYDQGKKLEKSAETMQKLNKTMSNMKLDIQSMDRRIDSYTNDIVLDTKIQTKVQNIKSSLDLSLMSMRSNLDLYENKLSQLERQSNLSTTLLNHFRKTLNHNHNESKVNLENIKSEIIAMENNLKEEISSKFNINHLENQVQDLSIEVMFFKQSVLNLKKNTSLEDRKLAVEISELATKTQSIDWQLTSLHDHAQRILEIERNQTLLKNNYDLMRELMKLVHLEQKLKHNRWIEFNFTHHSTQNACFNKQYVKRNHISKDGLGAYVGVQLCSPSRYKIFLGNSLDEDFLDIGDQYGHGQDHCQFIGAKSETGGKVDTKFPSAMGEKAFLRKQWDEKPHLGYLSFMTPTPSWYECGLKLP